MWIARDKNNRLYTYNEKPIKSYKGWRPTDNMMHLIELPSSQYPEVKWGDKEPRELILKPLDRYDIANKTVDKSNLRPFNLEAAKAGKPVCTRDGRMVRIICFDAKRKDKRSIIALVPSKDYPGFEDLIVYPNNGNYYGGHENDGDLMMLPEKKEGWVNVYHNEKGEYWSEQVLFSTKKEAIDFVHDHAQYVTTAKIEWEE